jgi:hypothetical protein
MILALLMPFRGSKPAQRYRKYGSLKVRETESQEVRKSETERPRDRKSGSPGDQKSGSLEYKMDWVFGNWTFKLNWHLAAHQELALNVFSDRYQVFMFFENCKLTISPSTLL